jgi:drug/metabolite transporter (DMT)-like permease
MKYLLILMAAVLYGLGGALIRPVSGTPVELGEISSLAVGGARSLIALVFTLSIIIPLDCLLKRQKLGYPPIRLSSKWVWSSAISRGINTLAFATAVVFSSISTAYLLCNMTIVGMLIWQKFVDKKSPDSWQIWTALVVIASCGAYFAVDPHHLTMVGLIAGVIGLFSFSGFFFFNSKIAQKEGPQFITGAVMLSHILAIVLAILGIAVCFGLAGFSIHGSLSWERLWLPMTWPSNFALVLILLLGIFQGGLADWLIAKGQSKGPNLMFMAFVPTLIMLWAPFLGWRTLGETMFSPAAAVLFVVAHGAILYGSIRGARTKK